jgi:hypothetical protein
MVARAGSPMSAATRAKSVCILTTYQTPLRDITVRTETLGERARPREMIDIQSFIWVLGSDEYAG